LFSLPLACLLSEFFEDFSFFEDFTCPVSFLLHNQAILIQHNLEGEGIREEEEEKKEGARRNSGR
jgi:hypothetical protein